MSSGAHDESPFDADHPTGRMPFAFRAVPDPLPFEPAHAWVRRAALMNGQPSFETLAFQLGLNPARLGPRTCLALALASDPPDPERLVRNTPVVQGNRVMLGIESVSLANWSITSRRHCPACLAESAHHRFFWDLTFFLECPFHGVPLEGGPGAGRVTWASTDMGFSSDGRCLSREAPRIEPLPRTLESYTLGRLGVVGPFSAPMLDGRSLDDIAYCVPMLGTLLARRGEDVRLTANRLALGPEVVTAGFEALSHDGAHLVERLEERAHASLEAIDPRGLAGMVALFGRTAELLSATERRMELARDILDAMRLVTANIGRVKRPSVATANFSLKRLVVHTGFPVRTLWHLLELAGVRDKANGRFPQFYTQADVELVRTVYDGTVPAARVGEALGLRVRDLYALESSGVLRTVTYDRLRGKRVKRYHMPDAELLAQRFGADIEPKVPSVSFRSLALASGIAKGELARRVVLGEVVPVGRRGRGICFNGMRFAPPVKDRIAVGRAVPLVVEPGVSARQASLRLDVPTETLRWLCDEGQLGSVGSNLRSGGIPPEAVERLERLYVSTSLLAPKMGVFDGRNAAFILERRGATVLRPNVRSTGLVLRSDVDALDPSLLAVTDLDRAWTKIRDAVKPTCGNWELPKSMKGKQVTFRTSDVKVSVTFRIGDALTMTVVCSREAAIRRWRILQPLMEQLRNLLPQFRLEGEGDDISLSAEFRLPVARSIEAGALEWFNACLVSLADVFGGRAAGRLPDPDRERRAAALLEARRNQARDARFTAPRKGMRKAPSSRKRMLEALGHVKPAPKD